MCFSGFFVVILCLTVQINQSDRLIISLSVSKRTTSAGDQIMFSFTVESLDEFATSY